MRSLLFFLIALSFSANLYAAECGKKGQRPCTIFEKVPPCNPGLIEARGRCMSRHALRPRRPGYCGRNYQHPCKVTEFIPSCVKGLIKAWGRCMTPQAAKSKPRYCGGNRQRPCNILEFIPSCTKGLIEIRGACQAKGQCGTNGKRPCGILERVPSCNLGLKENFKRNICKKLLPGETLFLGRLKSLFEFYGAGMKTLCKQTLSNINISNTTNIDRNTNLTVEANCAKNIFVGASCEYLTTLLGANVTGTVGSVASAPRQIADSKRQVKIFKRKVSRAYQSNACKKFAEKFAVAKRHRLNRGVKCPSGQFWDPNGNCYSCPKGYTRTLYPVTSRKSCVNMPAGELARGACSIYIAATQDFIKTAACTTEVLSSGAFTKRKIDFNGASRKFCIATGELTYALTSIMLPSKSPKQKAEQITTSLQTFLNKAQNQYAKFGKIESKNDDVKTVIDKFRQLKSCR